MARVCVSATAAVLTSFSACLVDSGDAGVSLQGPEATVFLPWHTMITNALAGPVLPCTHTYTRTQNPTSNGLWIKLVFPPASLLFLFPPSVKERKLLAKLSFVRAFQRHSPNTGPSFRSSGISFRTQFVHSVEKLWPLTRCCCDVFLPYDIVYCIRPIPHFTTGIVSVCFFFSRESHG